MLLSHCWCHQPLLVITYICPFCLLDIGVFLPALPVFINCNCNWCTCIASPTRRPRVHHRVNPYPGACRHYHYWHLCWHFTFFLLVTTYRFINCQHYAAPSVCCWLESDTHVSTSSGLLAVCPLECQYGSRFSLTYLGASSWVLTKYNTVSVCLHTDCVMMTCCGTLLQFLWHAIYTADSTLLLWKAIYQHFCTESFRLIENEHAAKHVI